MVSICALLFGCSSTPAPTTHTPPPEATPSTPPHADKPKPGPEISVQVGTCQQRTTAHTVIAGYQELPSVDAEWRGCSGPLPAGPLAKQKSALATCYRSALAKNPSLAGRVRAQFQLDANGKVTRVVVSGPAALADCAKRVVRQTVFPSPGKPIRNVPGVQRTCSIAFTHGPPPPSRHPIYLHVTPQAITVNGKAAVKVSEVMASSLDEDARAELDEALLRAVGEAAGATKPENVSLVISGDASVDGKVVDFFARFSASAEFSLRFALGQKAKRIVINSFGTYTWPYQCQANGGPLQLRVTKAGYELRGVRAPIINGNSSAEALTKQLRQIRNKHALQHRSDLAIAAYNGTKFGQVITALRAAVAAGFFDVVVVSAYVGVSL